MSHNHPPLYDPAVTKKLSKSGKLKKLFYWFALCLLTIFVGLLLLRVLLAGGGERIESLHAFADSPWLLLFRIILYFLIWLFWEKLLSLCIKNTSPELVRHTRRPLLILLLGYELFFATNIIGSLI